MTDEAEIALFMAMTIEDYLDLFPCECHALCTCGEER